MFRSDYEEDFERLIAAGRLVFVAGDRHVFVADQEVGAERIP